MTSSTRNRTALTLLEVLIVLTLLIALMAMALPALRGPMADQRLRQSGGVIRVAFNKARVAAMRTGDAHAFRFQAGGNQYSTRRWSPAEEAFAMANAQETGEAMAWSGSADEVEKLPDDVRFLAAAIVVDARAATEEEQADPSQSRDQQPETDWSPPILFYPDGTASNAKVQLVNDRKRLITITLRGVTGTARVSDLMVNEDRLP
jgi:type II secretory pathway pseudopilin PulG